MTELIEQPLSGATVASGAAALASGGSSIAVRLGIQAGIIVGTTLLSRLFPSKAVLSKGPTFRREADPVAMAWDQKPLARRPVGDWVIDGGTVMAAFHKSGWWKGDKNDRYHYSDRCDIVVALAEGDLPRPQLRIPVDPPEGSTETTKTDHGLVVYVNGFRLVFRRALEVDSDSVTRGVGDSINMGSGYKVRYHYEPEDIGGPVHTGAIRIYWNNAGLSDDVRWAELKAYLTQKPSWWEDKPLIGKDKIDNGDYTQSEWYNIGASDFKLTGISGLHIILNYTSRGIKGNQWNKDNKRSYKVTSVPSFSFEYKPNQSGNPADLLQYLTTQVWGFPSSVLDTTAQAAAKKRCDDYKASVYSSSGGSATNGLLLQPMRVHSVLRDDESPLRLLQMLETVTGGRIAFKDNKVSIVPGEYHAKSTIPAARRISEGDLWEAPTVTTNIPNSQRRNAIEATMVACLQSNYNQPVSLPLFTNQHLVAEDNAQLVERINRIAYTNDYYNAQQLMSIHNELQGIRRRVVLPIRNSKDASGWAVGTALRVNIPSAGIDDEVYIIEEIEFRPDDGLIVSAHEQGSEDPFAFLSYDDLDIDPDDAILVPVETGEILVPAVSNVRRVDWNQERTESDTILFDVAFIDEDYNYSIQIQYQIGSSSSWNTVVRPKNQLTYQLTRGSFLNETITLRMRYFTGSLAVDAPAGAWTEEFESAPVVPPPPVVKDFVASVIQDTSILLLWTPALYKGHKHTEIRYGSGMTPGEKVIGNPIIALGGSNTYGQSIINLTQNTTYWVQIRHVNRDDVATAWENSTYLTFMTKSSQVGAVPWVLSNLSFDLKEEATVDLTLPEASSIPSGTTLTYSLVGSLPSGLSFNAATRKLTGEIDEGTAQTTRAYLLTYRATDSSDATRQASSTVYINVEDDATPITFDLGSFTPPELTAGVAITSPGILLPAATGGEGTLTYTHGTLPTGLSVDATTRRLTGTIPSGVFGLRSFAWTASDGTRTQTIYINLTVFSRAVLRGLSFGDASRRMLLYAKEGTAYESDALPEASGAHVSDITYTLTPALPSGLSFSATTRKITGTPAQNTAQASAPRTFVYKAANSSDATDFDIISVGLHIAEDAETLVWSTTPDGVRSLNINPGSDIPAGTKLPQAANGVGAVSYAAVGLPNWITLNTTTRVITGTAPAISGPYQVQSFAWRVSDKERTLEQTINIALYKAEPKQEHQVCYWLGGLGGVVATLPKQTNAEKTNKEYLPTFDARICLSALPVPTSTLPCVWEVTRTWSDEASLATDWQPVRIIERYEVEEEQRAYRSFSLDEDGDPPTLQDILDSITNKQNEQTTEFRDSIPEDWSPNLIYPTEDVPFVYCITRHLIPNSRAWTTWGNPVLVADYRTIETTFQYAYQRTTTKTVPTITNTFSGRGNDSFTPEGWDRTKLEPTSGMKYVYRIRRDRIRTAEPYRQYWQAWGQAELISDYDVGGDVQYAYQRFGTKTTPVLTQPSQGQASETAVPRTGSTDWSSTIVEPTNTLQYVYRATRRRIRNSPYWTEWGSIELFNEFFQYSGDAPSVPTGVMNATPTDDGVVVSWSSTGSHVTEIEVDEKQTSGTNWFLSTSAVTYAQSYRITGLEPNKDYRYRVRHRNLISGKAGPWFDFQ